MQKAKFASTQINLPAEHATDVIAAGKALIAEEDLAGKGREAEPHITVKYGVREEPLSLMEALQDVEPFEVTLRNVETFPPTENSDNTAPVIIRVESAELKKLHDLIHAAVGAREDDFSYSPHITLAYVKPEAAAKYTGSKQFDGTVIPVSGVTLSTAGLVQIDIPFGSEGVASMDKRFEKFVPLTKVQEQSDGTLRVYGLVTAEQPDLEKQVCDYATTKPFYMEKVESMKKATSVEGMEQSIMPMREMHTLKAIGKGISIEFNDVEKTISMGFEVVDADAIMKFRKGVLIGFSQGGDYVGPLKADPVFKGCERYTANPGEVSGVDSPCLPIALVESMKARQYEYCKANGSMELRKFKIAPPKVETGENTALVKLNGVEYEKASNGEEADLEFNNERYKKRIVPPSAAEEVANATVAALVKAGVITMSATGIQSANTPTAPLVKEKKTKRVGGQDLASSDFAYVGDVEDTATWKLPIHDKAHAQNALTRFNQTEGIPDDQKKKVKAKIVAAAKEHGVNVSEEADKVFKLHKFLTCNELEKSLWDIHDLTDVLSTLAFVQQCQAWEEEVEGDASVIPVHLGQVIDDLVQCYLELVEEETKELVAATGGGKEEKTMNAEDLKKRVAKATEHIKKGMEMCKANHEAMVKLSKSHSDAMTAHLGKAAGDPVSEEDVEGDGTTSTTVGGGTQGGYEGAPHTNAKAVTVEDIKSLLADFTKAQDEKLEENTTNVLKAVFTAMNGEAQEVQPGVGDRTMTTTKVHQTTPVKKDGDMNNPAAPPAAVEKVSPETAGAALHGDQAALLKLAKSIRPSATGVPDSLAQRLTR